MKYTEEQKKSNKKELLWTMISTGTSVFLTGVIAERFSVRSFLLRVVLVCIICGLFELGKFFVRSVMDNLRKNRRRPEE